MLYNYNTRVVYTKEFYFQFVGRNLIFSHFRGFEFINMPLLPKRLTILAVELMVYRKSIAMEY